MLSHSRSVFILVLLSLLLAPGRISWAQDKSDALQPVESDAEMFEKVEPDVQLLLSEKFVRNRLDLTHKTERQLKRILELCPNTSFRGRIEESLAQVQEILGLHSFNVAQFYFGRARAQGHGMKGAEARLLQIIRDYPNFSRMDEALLLLGKVYLAAEQPNDAANYLWKMICRYPTSRFINEAFEQVYKTGFDASKGCGNLEA